MIKNNFKRLVQQQRISQNGADESTTIHFIPEVNHPIFSQSHKDSSSPEHNIMTKCVAKELLQNLDFDALDFDQAKSIHTKLHIITPTLQNQVDYSTHDLSSLKSALHVIRATYEEHQYDMSKFPSSRPI